MSNHLTRIQKMKETIELSVDTTNEPTNSMNDLYAALKKQNDERIKQGLQPSKTFIFKRMSKNTTN